MSPIILVGAGVLLFVLGAGLGYWISHMREATKTGDVQNELDTYRRQVTEHFSETAQHFQALGEQYRSLYKHMATGADALCDPAQVDGMLEFPAADAPALTKGTEEEAVPEPIKDYAPEEVSEPGTVDAKAEEPETPEAPEEISAADEIKVESEAAEEIPEAISQSTTEETERTVH